MKKVMATAAAAILAAAIASCGSATAPPPSHKAVTPAVTHTAPPSTAPAPSASAATDRAFADAMAQSVIDHAALRATVAGPVMVPYAEFQAEYSAALAGSGSPGPDESVTAIPGGYSLCGTTASGGTSCDSFTGFRHDAAGRITGFSVDGQPVAGRLATGQAVSGSGVSVSNVVAYRLSDSSLLAVAFTIRTAGAINNNPPFLATFNPSGGGQYSQDDSLSVIPGRMGPGASAVAFETFHTPAVTGTFTLLGNDQVTVLARVTLSTP